MTAAPQPIQNTVRVPATPAQQGQQVTVRARPDREYVSARDRMLGQNAVQALPFAIDDLTADLGDNLYDRMKRDAQVLACLNIMKAAIIEEGVTLSPVVEKPSDPGYKKSKRIYEFCQQNLEWLRTPLDDVLWNMLDAIAYGNKVAELVYIQDGNELWLDAIKPKPRRSVAFAVDGYNNVVGIVGAVHGLNTTPTMSSILLPNNMRDTLLPREKFAVCTFRSEDGDPRGTSVLRAAYNPWNFKMQLWQEYLKFLAQFATPSLFGTTPENAVGGFDLDASGNEVAGTYLSAEDRMLNALLAFKNGTAVVFPYGSSLTPVAVDYGSGGAAFAAAFDLVDRQITKAILHQTLATEEGKHQARAAASVHQDTMGMILRQAKKAVRTMIRTDILWKLVSYNFGVDAAYRFTPKVSLGEIDPRERVDLINAVAAATRAGFIAPDQQQRIDTMLGFPQRSGVVQSPAEPGAGSESATETTSDPDDADMEETENV